MSIKRPFPLKTWIAENRDKLKPPVGNQQIYLQNDDFIVMVVGGPNARRDYHYNEGEELFYQIEGDITLKIIEDGHPVDIPIREGEMFLLPPRIPHSPRRPANTVGLVIERYRRKGEKDGFMWFCENCGAKLHEEFAEITDIVAQLPPIMNRFYSNPSLCTCQQCGTVAVRPS
ncbi:MAG: 3-hydroxyanthranilate 3,4-dioxygenase [Cytophagales bacterium]|nr:3-hydroxyanthranilate 3,4-dioxygenase [Cytophagales bacterium]MDW8385012.1 3-hydroxyanthranilate 3,4-dioxygenase [Flammeovirgaceae bacterium]